MATIELISNFVDVHCVSIKNVPLIFFE